MKRLILATVVGWLLQSTLWGWWDTQVMSVKETPRIAEIEAEKAAPGGGAAVLDDQPPFGPAAGGGKAVELKPGAGSLTWTLRLEPSVYKLLAIARVAKADPVANGTPEWPLSARMTVTGPGGKAVGDWSMPVNYLNTYYDTARMLFPAHEAGDYTIVFSTTAASGAPLLVDRLELRDELGNTLKKGFKKGRYLTTEAELAQLRKTKGGPPPGLEPKLDPTGRVGRVEAFRKAWGDSYASWNTPERGHWPVKDLDQACLETGDPKKALEAAQLLIRAADWYPALDWSAQITNGLGNVFSRSIRFTFTAGRYGKIQYSGWEIGYPDGFARLYDALFPFITENADELAEMARVRVPWIKNRDDLIAFLDTRLLQYSGDCVNRNILRCAQGGSEAMMLPLIAVQGPNPAGERMARWLYTRTYWDMTNDGGIQDQAVTGRLRDGANDIGSIGYTEGAGQVLVNAAELMGRYIAAGGSKEFDLSDGGRFPSVLAGAFLPLECRVAGGYHPRIGDWGRAMDPSSYKTIKNYADCIRFAWKQNRDPRMAWLLKNVVGRGAETDAQWVAIEQGAAAQRDPQLSSMSRNLEGFGLAILESGTESDDVTAKRALTFRHGTGKGHGHADSLSLEYFAHGLRALPDSGNRGGSPHPGDMRCHLGVTVDGSGMRNSTEINVSGTAWTTAFAPAPGAQYVAGSARFGATPQATRYERQAALIDIAGTNASYVFDVLRVAGGTSHTWSTHGPAMATNAPPAYAFAVKPAVSESAKKVLADFSDPREGVAGAAASAAWTVAPEFEAKMLDQAYRPGQAPVVTRCTLFGHAGEPVFVGSSSPDEHGLENSQWLCTVGFMHVRKQGADGLQTVWPQLIESYRGAPQIKSVAALKAEPAEGSASDPAALAVETVSGQKDILVADGEGGRLVKAGGAAISGRFGFVSRDAKGLRLAHLAGGTTLEEGNLAIAAEAAGFERRVAAVDYAARKVTLDKPLPKEVPAGQEFLIGAPVHPQAWKASAVDGASLTLQYSPLLYQSEILTVDEKAGELVCAMNPNLLLADPNFYDGVTALDETGRRTWRVKSMRPKYIFMYLQESMQDWREVFTDADFADSDGDGKRTATLENWGGGEGSPAIAKLVLEVAFLDKARQVIYFKLPADPAVAAASGWAWAGSRLMDPAKGRWLVNEKGRRWIPNYAGKQNAIALEGEVRDAFFTDADKDGRRVLRMAHFGVGDTVTMQTSVSVTRREDGSFKVAASVPATVKVGGKDVR